MKAIGLNQIAALLQIIVLISLYCFPLNSKRTWLKYLISLPTLLCAFLGAFILPIIAFSITQANSDNSNSIYLMWNSVSFWNWLFLLFASAKPIYRLASHTLHCFGKCPKTRREQVNDIKLQNFD